jgi:hypothetical protein
MDLSYICIMSSNKRLNNQIDAHLMLHPRQPQEVGYFKKVAEIFGVHPEKIRKRWRMIQAKLGSSTSPASEGVSELISYAHVDANKFDITHTQVTKRPVKVGSEIKNVYQLKTSLKAKKIDTDLTEQKKLILDEIKKHKVKKAEPPYVQPFVHLGAKLERDTALEINIPDLHIGKLAWHKENGDSDYNINIAIERYRSAVKSLLGRVNPLTLEKIILPVGNDMINVDNKANLTTGGTPQSCDSRFGQMFQTAKELLVETIDYLSQIAPVEVIVIPGNHDTVAMFTLGEVLDAWYHNTDNVTVINTHTPRKYVQYGQNLIMYTHGHNERLHDLGLICATEQPQLWAATKFRRVHVGHLHHSKQIKYTDVQEHPGFTVKVLNSLSANDAWHDEKGYKSLKGAEAFLYHKEQGLLANYYYMNQ